MVKKIKFKAIVAHDKNYCIGNGINLPWAGDKSTSWDMQNFKELTTNKIVIYGYNTFKNFKRPLKNRLNLVDARVLEGEKFYSNKDPIISNKVDMTKNRLDTLFHSIPVNSFDYRFIFINDKLLLSDERISNFDHLNTNFKAIQKTILNQYEESGCNDDSITKIKNFSPNEVFIIGGAKTYSKYIDIIDEFIVTEFDNAYNGDIFFNKNLLKKFKKKEIVKKESNGKIVRFFN